MRFIDNQFQRSCLISELTKLTPDPLSLDASSPSSLAAVAKDTPATKRTFATAQLVILAIFATRGGIDILIKKSIDATNEEFYSTEN